MSSHTPASPTPAPAADETTKPSHFLRHVIEHDLEAGTYADRQWGGSPGDAAHHAAGMADPARVRMRFPPEPNGYLHLGHAKSIWLNFSLAQEYGGVCHLRFDDTNPEKEEQEYVDSIREAVQWLGYETYLADRPSAPGSLQPHEYFASDYFGFMYRAAEYLVEQGLAYVDEQTPEQMRANRGDFGTPGTNSPFRNRSVAENLARLREMRGGLLQDGAAVLRAKIDMASPNINMRDPALYRIRRATHHNTGDTWCIYPMYTFAHPIEDALEQITHSICTLEFEDQRPFYDWLLDRLAEGGLITNPHPRQYEFARLNVNHVITSKRKLRQLVEDHHVTGWDDPRMPTLAGLRRRGYTADALKLFCERSGVTKSGGWIEYSSLEGSLRETLETTAHRGMAVLNPVKLVLTNWAEVFGSDAHLEPCTLPALPHPAEGTESPVRHFSIGKEVWIEREDFEEVPPKGYKRLYPPRPGADGQMLPGNTVRLKGGYVIECTGAARDAAGNIAQVLATVVPDTKSGTPGADTVKVKAAITWVGVADGVHAEVRLYDRLFLDAQPDAGGKDFIESLNPNSLKVAAAIVEPSLAAAKAEDKFQFERHGYFVADRVDHAVGKPVFNLAVGLKDSWGK
jgi:glutaminyl-tRNA synthetase